MLPWELDLLRSTLPHKVKRLLFGVFLGLGGAVLVTATAQAFPKHSSYVIMDFNSGVVLDSERQDDHMQPASLTKLMTISILLDYLQEGKIKLTDQLRVSSKAASMPSSKLWLRPNSTISVQDALNAMIVKSANDAAYVVGENLGLGSIDTFVDMMNAKARRLHLLNTHFTNPNGLTNSKQYSSAYDLALLARNIMVHHSQYYRLFSQRSFKWHGHRYPSTNHLLADPNIDGLKTGYTFAAGFNMVVSSRVNGVRVIVSSLGNTSAEKRDNLVKNLADSGLIIANNFYFSSVDYVSPPKSVLLAANKLQSNSDLIPDNDLNSPDMTLDYSGEGTSNVSRSSVGSSSKNEPNYQVASSEIGIQEPDYYSVNNSRPGLAHPTLRGKNPTASTYKNWYLQVGVFTEISRAKEELNRVLLAVTPSFKSKLRAFIGNIKDPKHKGSTLYRVRLINLDVKEAKELCSKLKDQGWTDCFSGVEA